MKIGFPVIGNGHVCIVGNDSENDSRTEFFGIIVEGDLYGIMRNYTSFILYLMGFSFEHISGGHGVGGSNPLVPTNNIKGLRGSRSPFFRDDSRNDSKNRGEVGYEGVRSAIIG